jgi:hypothetical protein
MALGNPDYDPTTGALTLKAVDVNGVKTFEDVELVLNMSTGTFIITKASNADIRVPELPVQEVSKGGLKVGMRGCLATGASVTCHLILTSLEFNVNVRVGNRGGLSHQFTLMVADNKGNTYIPNPVTVSNTIGTADVSKMLIANVPTAATITMSNVSFSATSFSSMVFKIYNDDANKVFGEFEFLNIPF